MGIEQPSFLSQQKSSGGTGTHQPAVMCHGIFGHHPPSPRSPKHLAMHQSFLPPLRRAWLAEPPADTLFFFKNLEVLMGKGREGMSPCALTFLFTWTQTGWGLLFAPHQCIVGNKPASWNTVSFMQAKTSTSPASSDFMTDFTSFHELTQTAASHLWKSQPWLPWRWNRNEGDAFRSQWWQRQPAKAIPSCRSINAPTEHVHKLFQQAPC